MTARPELFVAVPSRSGNMTGKLHRWLIELMKLSMTGEIPFAIRDVEVEGLTPVQYARNRLCGIALKTKCERILMIDDDMMPDATALRILYHEADIAVPRMYRFRHHGSEGLDEEHPRPPEIATCATLMPDGPDGDRYDIKPAFDQGGIGKVDAAGTGFMMIRREVLEDPRMLTGQADPDGTPALFRLVQSDTGHISEWEDVDFTLRASQLGYSVVVDLDAHCGHRKNLNIDAIAELVHNERKAAIEQYIAAQKVREVA